MNAMKEIISAARRGDWEVQPDGRVFVFTNMALREGYLLEKDEFRVETEVRPEFRPGSGNRYAAAVVKAERP